MKQLMVLVATVVLGVSISGIILGLGSNASSIADNVDTAITAFAAECAEKLPDAE
ncbi:MAG: hypothetical protein Q4F55_04335 [Bacillota bacterium]|nr:hypothetical protein [Bacillota bacterium]